MSIVYCESKSVPVACNGVHCEGQGVVVCVPYVVPSLTD